MSTSNEHPNPDSPESNVPDKDDAVTSSPNEGTLSDSAETEAAVDESEATEASKIRFFERKMFKVALVFIAVLTGGLLVGGVVGYFQLMDHIEAGTLEEVAERLPTDTQALVVVRGFGELGRDFQTVAMNMPEDPEKERELQDRLEKIEDEYGIDLGSAWDLYETGLDPFRPTAVALLRTDLRQEFPEVEEGKPPAEHRELVWGGVESSVLLVMLPVHDEEDAFAFFSELYPKLDLPGSHADSTSMDLRRETAKGIAFGSHAAIGVENGYLFYVYSGDASYKAADELQRVMAIEPGFSLWHTSDFAQQRLLTDQEWNLSTWIAPAGGEKAVNRFVRSVLHRKGMEVLAEALGAKTDLEDLELGGISSVSSLSPEMAHFRTVVDLSPVLGADSITVTPHQQAAEVGGPGIFGLVSGTPLMATRITLNMEYFWDDWLAENAKLQEAMKDMAGLVDIEEALIQQLTGNITMVMVARDDPLGWTPDDPNLNELLGLMPSNDVMPVPVEAVIGIEFKDHSLLMEQLSTNIGVVCRDPESGSDIRWCHEKEGWYIGFSSDHLVVSYGVNRGPEIDAVQAGKAKSFYTLMPEEATVLTSGPDVQSFVWMQNMADQEDQNYLDDLMWTWLKLQTKAEKEALKSDPEAPQLVTENLTAIMSILVHPPAPLEVGPALQEAFAPVLVHLSSGASEMEQAHKELEAAAKVQEEEYNRLNEIYKSAKTALNVADAKVKAFEEAGPSSGNGGMENMQVAKLERQRLESAMKKAQGDLDEATDLLDEMERKASKAWRDSANQQKAHDDLVKSLDRIERHAIARQSISDGSAHVAYMGISMQVWEDAALAMDLNIYPKDGSFIPGIVAKMAEEAARR